VIEYRVHAGRIDAHGSLALAKEAEVRLDIDLAGRRDAMNPVELLLSALAACLLRGIERVVPMLHFQINGAEVQLEAYPWPGNAFADSVSRLGTCFRGTVAKNSKSRNACASATGGVRNRESRRRARMRLVEADIDRVGSLSLFGQFFCFSHRIAAI
jgi:hypothetical protein